MKFRTSIGLLIVLIFAIALSSCAASTTLTPPTETATPPLPTGTPTPPPECQSLSSTTSSPDLDGREVVKRMVDRLNSGDIAGAMTYFAADAKLYTLGLPPLGYAESFGAEAICGNWAGDVQDNLKWELTILAAIRNLSGIQNVNAKSEVWLDDYALADGNPIEFRDNIYVKGGQIIAYERMLKPESLSKLRSVLPPADFLRAAPAPGITPNTVGSEIEIIFTDRSCTYSGPAIWKAGPLTVNVEMQSELESALAFVHAGEGNDFYDLTVSLDIHDLGGEYSAHEFAPGESKTIQHGVNANVDQVFLRCFNKSPTIGSVGSFGPFIVEP